MTIFDEINAEVAIAKQEKAADLYALARKLYEDGAPERDVVAAQTAAAYEEAFAFAILLDIVGQP